MTKLYVFLVEEENPGQTGRLPNFYLPQKAGERPVRAGAFPPTSFLRELDFPSLVSIATLEVKQTECRPLF